MEIIDKDSVSALIIVILFFTILFLATYFDPLNFK